MTTFDSLPQYKRNTLHWEILKTLIDRSPAQVNNMPPIQNQWLTTRQIADIHDISIYKARLILLGLVKQGLVIVTDGMVKNSLRWYPHCENIKSGKR